jgi:hypothetical protein
LQSSQVIVEIGVDVVVYGRVVVGIGFNGRNVIGRACGQLECGSFYFGALRGFGVKGLALWPGRAFEAMR